MGHGSRGPRPFISRQTSTLFLRVPSADWSRIYVGEKTEFRARPGEASRLLTVNLPTPVVAYAQRRATGYQSKLMVLEEKRYEPLFNIAQDAEALAREGFETYDEFRRYWRARRKGIYRPMEMVHVFRVRPWGGYDLQRFGVQLLAHLYGEWLPTPNPLR